MPNPTPLRIALDAAGFYVALAAVLSLLLAGCGSEPEVQPAPPRPEVVATREVCTVQLLPDGTVQCQCVEVQQ
jgi:hypothetical protein